MIYFKLMYDKRKEKFELLGRFDLIANTLDKYNNKYLYVTEDEFNLIKKELVYTNKKGLKEYVR